MSCVSPIVIHVNTSNYTVPCGRCMNCRIKHQSGLEFLCTKELLYRYSLGQGASFVTLTYTDEHVPKNKYGYMTLRKSDLQKFFKRVRKNIADNNYPFNFSYVACGEYGDTLSRSHYHIVFLGLTDAEAQLVCRKAWPYGLIDVGPLTSGGLRYVLKYCSKTAFNSDVKALEEQNEIEHQFLCHSVKLGRHWIDTHIDDIVSNGFTFLQKGVRVPLPKSVMQYVSKKTGVDYRPYMIEYFTKEELRFCHAQNLDPEDYHIEQARLKERFLIDSARSRGINVTPEFISSRHWIKPKHSRFSPEIPQLVDKALE